jgi:hypothetical protein
VAQWISEKFHNKKHECDCKIVRFFHGIMNGVSYFPSNLQVLEGKERERWCALMKALALELKKCLTLCKEATKNWVC